MALFNISRRRIVALFSGQSALLSGALASDSTRAGGNVTNRAETGQILWPQSAAELAAGVTPVNTRYPPGVVDRYGTNEAPGRTDMAAAIQAALDAAAKQASMSVGGQADVVFLQSIYAISKTINLNPYSARVPLTIRGAAKKLYPNFSTDWQTVTPSWGTAASTIQYMSGSHGAIFSGGSTCDVDGLVMRCGQARHANDVVWATGTEPSHIRIQRCLFQNLAWIANNPAGAWGAWQFHDNQVTGCGQGPYVGGIFQGCIVDMLVWGNGFTSTNGTVFDLTAGAGDSVFTHNRFEEGNSPAILIRSHARKHVITDNVFDNHFSAAIELRGADPGQTITGNFFNRNGAYGGGTPNGGSSLQNACHIYIVASGGHWIENCYIAEPTDSPRACMIQIDNSTISIANSFAAGQPVMFASSGALPSAITAGKIYFVSAANRSAATFQISSSHANAIAGTSISLTGSHSGRHSVSTFNPLWILGLESCTKVAPIRFGGVTRHGCATSFLVVDRHSDSSNCLEAPASLTLPQGADPGGTSDDFAAAVAALNGVCVNGTVINLMENRLVSGSFPQCTNICLRGTGGTRPTLTNNSGAIGFQSMDGVAYGGITYTVRRGWQHATAQPDPWRTQGVWGPGDVLLNAMPPAGASAGWYLSATGSPDSWKTWGATGA